MSAPVVPAVIRPNSPRTKIKMRWGNIAGSVDSKKPFEVSCMNGSVIHIKGQTAAQLEDSGVDKFDMNEPYNITKPPQKMDMYSGKKPFLDSTYYKEKKHLRQSLSPRSVKKLKDKIRFR